MMTHDELMQRDTDARARAIDISRSVMVKAPAGSGKTTLLAQRALACLSTVADPEEVLAITFTNKAANEMRARILQLLQRASDGVQPTNPSEEVSLQLARRVLARDQERGWNLLLNPSRLRVMTIDALNSFLAGLAPIVSGIGAGMGVDERPGKLYREAIVALVDGLDDLDENDEDRRALLRLLALVSNRVEGLIPMLRAMLVRRDQWLPIVLTRLDEEAGERLVEASRQALAGLVRSRLRAVGVAAWAGDLDNLVAAGHEAGALPFGVLPEADTQALAAWKAVAGLALKRDGGLRTKLTKADGIPAGTSAYVRANAAIKALGECNHDGDVESVLGDLAMLPALDELGRAEGFALDMSRVLRRLCGTLALVFQRRGSVDFVEVAMRALSAASGAGGHEPLVERMDYAISHVLVDEMQDTSASQYALLSVLTQGWEPGDGRTLFCVGDPQQSIYSFREAEVRLFVELWHRKSIHDLQLDTVELSANFRSRPAIIDACNQMFGRVFPARDDLYAGSVSYARSVATRDEGGRVDIEWFNGDADEGEAQRVVEIAREVVDGDPDATIAILVRARADVRHIVKALKAAGIGYACQDIDPLGSTDAVRDVVGLIRALWHPGDRVAWGTLLRAPFVGLSWADFAAITKGRTRGAMDDAIRDQIMHSGFSSDGRARLNRLLSIIDTVRREEALAGNLADLAEAVWLRLGGAACVTPAEAEDVRQVFGLLRESLIGGLLASPEEFDDALRELYAAPGVGRVQIMTVHKAKGLEFDHVILAGLWRRQRQGDAPLLAYRHTEEGLLLSPAIENDDDEAHAAYYKTILQMNRRAERAEALRVLYVAATRARERLVMICTATAGGRDGALIPAKGSLAELLWPYLGPIAATAHLRDGVPSQAVEVLESPLSPRLPADYQYPRELVGYVPPESRVVQPSELVVRGEAATASDENVFERVVGIAVHLVLEHVARSGGAEHAGAVLDRLKGPLVAQMRHRGMPEPRLMEALGIVMDLAQRAVNGKNGRWLLQAHPQARSEARIAGYVDGEWVSGVIDRCFVVDGTLNVIDYKSSGRNVSDADWPGFIDAERASYRRQIKMYGRVGAGASGLPTREYLYFPARDALVEV